MKAGQLSIPLERPVGLRSVSNPLPADGAADPETRDRARGGRAQFGEDLRSRRVARRFRGDRDRLRARRPRLCDVGVERIRAHRPCDGGGPRRQQAVGCLARRCCAAPSIRRAIPIAPLMLANFVRVPIVIVGAPVARSGLRGGCNAGGRARQAAGALRASMPCRSARRCSPARSTQRCNRRRASSPSTSMSSSSSTITT